jgi:hypothetical protein
MFFSVKTPTKIAGKVYTPCVCYPLPDVLKPTIEKMVKEEKAYIYDTKVFFQNGKVIEKKVVEAKPADTKKTKKAKKEDIKEDIKEEEDIPSPQEIADDMTAGDF